MSPAGLRDASLAVVWLLSTCTTQAREVSVALLHTANLNGQVLSLRYRANDAYHGGMLRLASRIDDVRRHQEHVILVDCGGLVTGSPESELSGGLLPLSALARMGYDLRLPLLDEWCGGGAGLDPAGIAGAVPWLWAGDAPSWRIIERGGVRFGFVGVAEGVVPVGCTAAPPPPDEVVRRALAALRRESVDVLVLLYHTPGAGRRHETQAFCRQFPDFDLVLLSGGGEVVRSESMGSTYLTEAGTQGRWLGRVDITFDTVAGVVTGIEPDLLEVTTHVPESASLRRALGANLGRIRRELEEVIGYTARNIGGGERWPGQSDMTGLVAVSVVDGDELVLLAREPGGMLSQGEIAYRDILRAVPDPGPWAQIQVRPPDLRRILEENLSLLSSRRFLGAAGFTYHAALQAATGDRIRELRLAHGKKPHGRALLTIRFPAYLAQDPSLADERAVLREIAARPDARFQVTGIDTRIRVMKYIRAYSPVTIRPSRTLTILPDAP